MIFYTLFCIWFHNKYSDRINELDRPDVIDSGKDSIGNNKNNQKSKWWYKYKRLFMK